MITAIPKAFLPATLASLALTVASHADTTFATNTSGNAAGLAGVGATDTTALTLSAGDGGGTVILSTVSVNDQNGATTLGMDGDSLGVNNDKWGVSQVWTFSFNQTLSFDNFVLSDVNTVQDRLSISSSAWVGLTVTNGTNRTFDGTTGTVTTDFAVPAAQTAYDFTGSGLTAVPSGTNITISHVSGGGGVQLHSFTVDTIAADTDPPTPDPMTWASVPAAVSDSSITMTATTASDTSGVEYYFTCTSGAGNDSGWQSSPTYVDTGLSPNTTYTYTVKARDAVGLYETAASAAESATTEAPDTAKPSPDPMTFAVAPAATGPYSISMTATTDLDVDPVDTNGKAVVQFGQPFTLTLVVQNNDSLDLALDKIHSG